MQTGAFGKGLHAGTVIFAGLALAGCGGSTDGRFGGAATTTVGACGLGFGADGKAAATLMIRGGEVEFVPSDGVTVLPGHVDAAGHVRAGSSAAGADKKPFLQVFEGDREGDVVRGVFATPRCRAVVVLKRG